MSKSTPALIANDDSSKSGKQRMKHDELFKKAMENPLVAREFFETHLPEGIRKIVDLSSLHLEKETFIEESLKSSASDLLFRVKVINKDKREEKAEEQEEGAAAEDQNCYLYLLSEQQTKPDRFMAFRLFKYMANIIVNHRDISTT